MYLLAVLPTVCRPRAGLWETRLGNFPGGFVCGALDPHCPQHQEGGGQCFVLDAGFLLIYGRSLFTVSLFPERVCGQKGVRLQCVCDEVCLVLSGGDSQICVEKLVTLNVK